MNVLSFNENLLERLLLLLQNNFGNDSNISKKTRNCLKLKTNFILVEQKLPPLCSCSFDNDDNTSKWIILCAKKQLSDDENCKEYFADILRQMMSKNDNHGGILLLKKEKSIEDVEAFNAHVASTVKEWKDEWIQQLEKFKKFGDSKAKIDYTNALKRWSSPKVPNYKMAYFDDRNLTELIESFFDIKSALLIEEVRRFSAEGRVIDPKNTDDHPYFFTKPPSLNWSSYPREGEIQITIKFNFVKGTATEFLFRRWAKAMKNFQKWEYEYEWTNGILMREDIVKIALTRIPNEPDIVEISGRLDIDELGEDDSAKPARKIWPYISKQLGFVMSDINQRQYLPYTLYLVFFGEIFFNCPAEAPKIFARTLNAVQTFGSIERTGTVKFLADQSQPTQSKLIYTLNLDECFPGFRPFDICAFDEKTIPKANTPNKIILQNSDQISEKNCNDIAKNKDNKPYEFSLRSAELHPIEHKPSGRRVSFGIIHSIPSMDNSVDIRDATQSTSNEKVPSKMSSWQQLSTPSNQDGGDGDSPKLMCDYVGEILQQAIEEALIV